MQKLNFPTYNFKAKKDIHGKTLIYDEVRKKYVSLTPEEWVRQHALSYLINEFNIPIGFVQVEKTIIINDTSYRFDAMCKTNNEKIFLLLECKAPDEKISQATFDQLMRYNNVLFSSYLWITNGQEHYFFEYNSKKNKYEKKDIFKFNKEHNIF